MLSQTRLFAGIAPDEITELLDCLHARCENYAKGDMIIAQGDHVHAFGVLLISYDRMLGQCEKVCPHHERLLRNYIGIVAMKGLVLHDRIDCLLRPTLRDKIMNYLLRVSREQQATTFSIPMNRNLMSEYLNIERSALSRELSRMKRDGLIDHHRNSFRLL